MKTLLKRNIFISLMSLGLISSITANTPKPMKDLAQDFKIMIMDPTKTVEDATAILIQHGRQELADLIIELSEKIFALADELGIDLTLELSLEDSDMLGRKLGAMTHATAYIALKCPAVKKLRLLGELAQLKPILSQIANNQRESDRILHMSLLRRKDKKQVKTTQVVHVNENFDFTTGSSDQGNLTEHHVNVHGDLTVEHTATTAVKAADKKTNS